MYTTGNSARNTTLDKIRYFQPLSTDTGYLADWGTSLTVAGCRLPRRLELRGWPDRIHRCDIGWDKYGRAQIGAKATYAITPQLSVMGGANGHWTAQPVDRNGVATPGAGITPVFTGATPRDNSRFVGTEFMALISYRFAPDMTGTTRPAT